jgi:DNA-binding NarL/FixJ family response regulator
MTLPALSSISDVLLCEDHPFVQMGLELSLKDLFPGLRTLRKSMLGRDALRMAKERKPDLAFVDLGLPDISGLELIQELKTAWPDLKIVVVTGCDNAATLLRVKKLGVSGILQKVSSHDRLRIVVESIFLKPSVQTALDPRTTEILKSHRDVEFTPREYDVLQEIIQGKSNQQIAEKLGCALTTVRFHRANLFEKTGVRSAAELTAWFLQGQRQSH